MQTRKLRSLLLSTLIFGALGGCSDASENPEATTQESADVQGGEASLSESTAFITRAAPGAQRSQAEYSVPASVTIAQAILESGWGKSGLAAKDNNYFGIKCVSPSNPGGFATGCHNYPTQECNSSGCYSTNAYFRVYASMDDSMRDHGALLRGASRYAAAFKYTGDPDQFIREVKKGGYATDPNYSSSVINLMKTYNLYQYDRGGAQPALGDDGCTEAERNAYATTACGCVDHKPAGGFCEGSGCTATEEKNCATYGTQCVDHRCSGGFTDGHGCTALEEKNCEAYGTQCVDHKCSGGFGEGHGCTALEEKNCAAYGTQCVDHLCSGGFGDGHGCTALEEKNCASYGTQCVDHLCSGGFGEGNGCTAKEAKVCDAGGQACRDHLCVAR